MLPAAAQHTPLQKYVIAPAGFDHVFLDHVEHYACCLASSEGGQYIGQTNDEGIIYGYGYFVSDNGNQRIGQFRKGQLLFGITMNDENVIVGDNDFYTVYSLSTGRMEYIFKANMKQLVSGERLYDYAFVSMNYNNGDRYVGEIYQGKRHGYGIYYYANGDFWYGQYNNDVRCGFGALFTVENRMVIGQWNIEDTPRVIHLKNK